MAKEPNDWDTAQPGSCQCTGREQTEFWLNLGKVERKGKNRGVKEFVES